MLGRLRGQQHLQERVVLGLAGPEARVAGRLAGRGRRLDVVEAAAHRAVDEHVSLRSISEARSSSSSPAVKP